MLATQVACLELTGIIVLFIDQRRKKLLGWRLCHSVVLYFWSFFYVSHFAYLDCTSLTLWTAGFLSLTSVVFLKGTVSATSLFLFTSWGLTKLLEINAHPPPPPQKKKKKLSPRGIVRLTVYDLNFQRESNERRQVHQFHFTSWPDKGVPQHATAVLAFRRKLRLTPNPGPTVVHCR